MITTAYKFEANLQDVIRLTEEFKKAKLELLGLKKGTEEYKRASANLKDVGTQLGKAKKEIQGANTATQNLNRSGLNLVNTFKSAAVAIAAAFAFRAIVGGLKSIITSFKDFEAQMAAVKAISGATEKQFEELEKSALAYGKTTVFTATQVAQLQEEFARLGFTTDEIIKATQATLNLAAATGESLANSAAIAGSTLRAFQMDASLTQEVTDTMAAAFTSSALNLDRFTESMKFVAPVASTTGFTLQETTAILANLADNGIKGSIAGNSLKNILLKLADANSKLSKRIGRPVQGVKQLAEALRELQEDGFGATEAVELLDKRAAPAFLTLINNIGGLEESVELLNNAEGATSRMAAIRLDTLEGDMTLLQSATEGLTISLGEEFGTSIRNIIFSLTSFIQKLSENKTAIRALKFALELGAVALTTFLARAAAGGMLSFIKGIKSAAMGIASLIPGLRGATVAQQGLNTAMRMNPLVALVSAIAAVTSAYFLLGQEMSEAEMKQRRLNEAIRDELSATLELEEGTRDRIDAARQLKEVLGELAKEIDIEILSNEELAEIFDFYDLNEANRLTAIQLEERNKKLQDWIDGDEAFIEANKGKTDRITKGMVEEGIRLNKIRRKEIKDNQKQIDDLDKIYNEGLTNLDAYQNNRLGRNTSFRERQRKIFENELEDFREMNRAQQDNFLEGFEMDLQEIEWIVEYKTLLDDISDASGTQLEVLTADMKALKAEMSEADFKIDDELKNVDFGELGVTLSLMNDYVVKFKNALVPATDATTEFADVVGVKLRKTKDLVNEIVKTLTSGLSDDILSNQVSIGQAFIVDEKEIKDQQALITANLKDIAFIQEEGSVAGIAKTIELNKNKFDVLKLLSAEELAIMTVGEKEISEMSEKEKIRHKDKMLKILDDLAFGEIDKYVTNSDLLAAKTAERDKALRRLQEQNLYEMEKVSIDAEKGRIAQSNKENLNFIENFKKMQENRTRIVENEITKIDNAERAALEDNEQMKARGLISEEQYQANLTRITEDAIGQRNNAVQNGVDRDVEALSDAITQIGEWYQMGFDALSTFLDNRFAIEKAAIEDRREAEKADLNAAMEAELEAFEGNAEAQEDIRKAYALKEQLIEKKKQAELTKIKRKEFQVQKANDLVQATINGALAIIKATAQTGIFAAAAVPIVATLVAAQIAAIAAQKFVGAKGGIIPEQSYATGGIVVGKSHAQGGEKFAVGGRVVELEGGEAVINKRSTAMFRGQLSAMNAAGGGVRFAEGGITPMLQGAATAGSNTNMDDFASAIVNGINSKTVTVSEADITSSQENVSISELTSSLF